MKYTARPNLLEEVSGVLRYSNIVVGSSFDSCISLVHTLHHSTAAVSGLDFTGGACFEN